MQWRIQGRGPEGPGPQLSKGLDLISFLPGHIFLTCSYIFFFSTYRRSTRRARSNHHVSAEHTSDISGLYMYCLLAAIRDCWT